MPLGRSEVERAEKKIDKAIRDFLREKGNRNKVFSEWELIKVLEKGGALPDLNNYAERQATLRSVLVRLVRSKKVSPFNYCGKEYFGR